VSQPVPVFTGLARAGRVEWDSPAAASAWVRSLDGQRIEVTIRQWRGKRSTKANAYLFGVVYPIIAEHLGYTTEEAHEALAWHFLRQGNPDDPLPRRKSTATLNTTEFCRYIDTVKQFAAEQWGLYIPDAGEVAA
jgi:hypothetical protein